MYYSVYFPNYADDIFVMYVFSNKQQKPFCRLRYMRLYWNLNLINSYVQESIHR